jgi:hypothetical protein
MRCFLSARWGSPEERKKAARRANVWAIPLPELKNNHKYQKLFVDLLKGQWTYSIVSAYDEEKKFQDSSSNSARKLAARYLSSEVSGFTLCT